MRTGKTFSIRTRDGLKLSAVKFDRETSKGTLVIVPGRTEPWLKFGEVFYDFYRLGYRIYSFDLRGQGLSPHLSSRNPQIGHVEDFADYADDLALFLEGIRREIPASEKIFILSHSLGGAVAADLLAEQPGLAEAAVLSSPMLEINTAPYPEWLAETIVGGACSLGLGDRYAPGKTDYDLGLVFEKSDVTRSRARFEMTREIYRRYPKTRLGGPSSRWTYESIRATHRIVKSMNRITTPLLVFQAGEDQIVKPRGENVGCRRAKDCRLKLFPKSQHEIFMERDFIRDAAIRSVDAFLTAHSR